MKVVSLENLSKYNELLNQKTVKTVNNVKPDSNGNVTIETGKVKTVNNIQPDEHGNITIEIPTGTVNTVINNEPDSEGNAVLSIIKSVNENSSESSESSESHQSTDSINEISLDTHHRYHEITLNTSKTTLKFIKNQNSENNSTVIKLELFIKQGTGTNTVTWPDNVKWENGIEPVLSLEKDHVDLISLISLDNGQHYYGFAKAVWMN